VQISLRQVAGGVRWVLRVAPGQVLFRADIGGFGAGSEFSWNALAAYRFKFGAENGVTNSGGLVIAARPGWAARG
jgi:hypothetical protein